MSRVESCRTLAFATVVAFAVTFMPLSTAADAEPVPVRGGGNVTLQVFEYGYANGTLVN